MTPHYHLVPRGYRANLKFREEVVNAGLEDPEVAADLWQMCAEDPLFYVNTFVWTYNPRLSIPEIPFIAYEYQDDALLRLIRATGMVPGYAPHDVAIEKSRDAGGSWMSIISHEWLWQFRRMLSFLWVSRKEELVDKPDDPKALMWKLDFLLSHLPPFLRPQFYRSRLHAQNVDTLSTIDGESTTGDVGRGDRRTAILLDEFASVEDGYKVLAATADSTDCRMFNSTHKGTGTAFYMVTQGNIPVMRLHWSQHPLKNKGLYTSKGGILEVLDPEYEFPEGYEFILDDGIRSPWYDAECLRRASKLEIAQELDIDVHASGSQFYDPGVLKEAAREHVMAPYAIGEMVYDDQAKPLSFREADAGRLLLWVLLNSSQRPPEHQFVMGVDISAGSDASNSCAAVGDIQTGEKVAEFTTIEMLPYRFAHYCVALARWFSTTVGRCFMAWEDNGPGGEFGKTVLELGYGDVYHRRSPAGKMNLLPGWHATAESRRELHASHRRALAAKTFINRSALSNDEAAEYVYTVNGSVEHARSRSKTDPTGARANHGDRCKADALCWLAFQGHIPTEVIEPEKPQNTFAARRDTFRAKRRAERDN